MRVDLHEAVQKVSTNLNDYCDLSVCQKLPFPSYGDVPMNLSASERQQRRAERMARGECTYCGVPGHFRVQCAQRLAKEARDLRVAQLSFSGPVTSAPVTPVSGNAQSPTA
jgi:hypothetical protein